MPGAVIGTLAMGLMSTPSASTPLSPASGATRVEHAVFVGQRIELVPKIFGQFAHQAEAVAEARKTVFADQGFGQPGGDFEVFRLFGDDFRAEFQDRIPIGRRTDGFVAFPNHIAFGGTGGLAGGFDGAIGGVRRIVFPQRFTSGIIARNRGKQSFEIEYSKEAMDCLMCD